MIQRSSVLVFICFGLALLANVNARPHRRDLSTLVVQVPELIEELQGTVDTLLTDIVDSAVQQKLTAIKQLLNQLTTVVENLETTATVGVNPALNIIFNTLQVVRKALTEVTNLADDLTPAALANIGNILDDVVGILTSLINTILKLVVGIVTKVATALTLVNDVTSLLEGLKANAVGSVLTQVTQTLKQILSLKNNLLKIQDSIAGIKIKLELSADLEKILGTVTNVVNELTTAKSSLVTQGLKAVPQVLTIVTGLVTIVIGLLATVVGLVGGIVGGLLGGLTGALAGSLDFNVLSKRALY